MSFFYVRDYNEKIDRTPSFCDGSLASLSGYNRRVLVPARAVGVRS
jgi:hypothetical protein